MQSARLVQSFRLVDERGNKPSNVVNNKGGNLSMSRYLIDELMAVLLRKFTSSEGETNGTSQNFTPTPDNPFILGYTVSQKKPELENVNASAAKAKIPTPAFFMPKSFRCNLSPKSAYCEGTLNYCMLTHRALQPPDFSSNGQDRRIDDGVDGAGRFKENVFARLKSKAQPGSTEGALFFCQDIFVNHWIGSSVAPLFYLGPTEVSTQVATLIEDKYTQCNLRNGMDFASDIRPPTRKLSRNNEYKMTNTLRSGRKMIAVNGTGDFTESMKLEYDTTIEVQYKNRYDLRDDDEDLKRRLQFTVGSYTFIKIKFFRRKALSHVKDWLTERASDLSQVVGGGRTVVNYYSDDAWEEAYDANVWLNYKYSFEVGTSAQNRGSFTVENARSEHLEPDGQLKAYNSSLDVNDWHKPGLWKHTTMYNWAKIFSFAFEGELASLTSISEEAAKSGATLFKSALEKLTDSLGTTVILPAGDVFMFKGMSADSDHNVFTTISYDTPTGGTVETQAAKDVSVTRWQAPMKSAAGKK